MLRFDAANTFGESEGDFSEANITNYYEDLEDVISWFKSQTFYKSPFILCGHSLGALATAFYAEQHPQEIKALAPLSAVVNASLSRENYTKAELEAWEKTGWLIEDWDGEEVKLKWSYMLEKEKFDLLSKPEVLTMPVLMIVGELDDSTRPEHQQVLFNKLPGPKELHVVSGAPHTFRDKVHLELLYQLVVRWLKNLNN